MKRSPSRVHRSSPEPMFALIRAPFRVKDVPFNAHVLELIRCCVRENATQLVQTAVDPKNRIRHRLHALRTLKRLCPIDDAICLLKLFSLTDDPSLAIRETVEAILDAQPADSFPPIEPIYPPGWDSEPPEPPVPKRPRRRP